MSDEPSTPDIDFDDEMKQLTSQYETPAAASSKAPAPAPPKSDRTDLLLGLGEMIRPLALELDSIKRSGSDNSRLITALHKSFNEQKAVPHSLETMAAEMQRLGKVESANQKMFDTLHGELKSYKDNFLFDALQKPFIRDLATLFDDFTVVHTQTGERLNAVRQSHPEGDELPFLERIYGNLENNLHHILEVFLRMDVVIVKTPPGAPVDKKLHRAVSVAPAANPAEDSLVDRSVRPGFFWHDRSIRPEDVVVRRWTPAATPDVTSEAAKETVLIRPVADQSARPAI